MTSVSASHIILIPIPPVPVQSRRPEWGSNPQPPHEEKHSLATELPHPPKSRWHLNSTIYNMQCGNRDGTAGVCTIYAFKTILVIHFSSSDYNG